MHNRNETQIDLIDKRLLGAGWYDGASLSADEDDEASLRGMPERKHLEMDLLRVIKFE